MNYLDTVAREWLIVRDVIANSLGEFFHATDRQSEDMAAAIIARLSHAGFVFNRIEESK